MFVEQNSFNNVEGSFFNYNKNLEHKLEPEISLNSDYVFIQQNKMIKTKQNVKSN